MRAFTLDVSTVIEDLRAFVCEEAEVLRIKYAEQLAQHIQDRVENGTCWDRLQFLRIDEQGRAVFRHMGNDSRLREGDLITLGHSDHEDVVLGTIYREEGRELWITKESGFKIKRFEQLEGWFIDEGFLDLSSHYLAALDRLPG